MSLFIFKQHGYPCWLQPSRCSWLHKNQFSEVTNMFSCDSLISIFFWLYLPKMTIKLTIATGSLINLLKTPELYPVSVMCVSFYTQPLFMTVRNACFPSPWDCKIKSVVLCLVKIEIYFMHILKERKGKNPRYTASCILRLLTENVNLCILGYGNTAVWGRRWIKQVNKFCSKRDSIQCVKFVRWIILVFLSPKISLIF